MLEAKTQPWWESYTSENGQRRKFLFGFGEFVLTTQRWAQVFLATWSLKTPFLNSTPLSPQSSPVRKAFPFTFADQLLVSVLPVQLAADQEGRGAMKHRPWHRKAVEYYIAVKKDLPKDYFMPGKMLKIFYQSHRNRGKNIINPTTHVHPDPDFIYT